MKKLVTLLACATCAFSSAVYAEETIPATQVVAAQEDGSAPKSVGKGAQDGSQTAKSSAWKYVLPIVGLAAAAGAIVWATHSSGHHHSSHSHTH